MDALSAIDGWTGREKPVEELTGVMLGAGWSSLPCGAFAAERR